MPWQGLSSNSQHKMDTAYNLSTARDLAPELATLARPGAVRAFLALAIAEVKRPASGQRAWFGPWPVERLTSVLAFLTLGRDRRQPRGVGSHSDNSIDLKGAVPRQSRASGTALLRIRPPKQLGTTNECGNLRTWFPR